MGDPVDLAGIAFWQRRREMRRRERTRLLSLEDRVAALEDRVTRLEQELDKKSG